jgi:N-acetylneuraminate synthase
MKNTVSIDGRLVGQGQRPYIVAEMSANHNGDLGRALALMEAIKAAGADAVKLQTYTADTLTIDHDSPEFRISGGLWNGRRLYELYQEAQTPWDWHEQLFAKGRELGITVFSTPFDETAIDLLERLGAPAYKIASFEASDHALVARAAVTGKPLIISTGLASRAEISETVRVARENGGGGLVLLHCVSAYPAPAEQYNLRTIPDLADTFGVIVGLSDHTMGNAVAVAATTLGAAVIEKHVTLARADGGADSAFSLEPDELLALCEGCRTAWSALGSVNYDLLPAERGSIAFRRSLYVVRDIQAGAELTADNVRSIRPGFGLAPKHLPEVLGARASHAVSRGTPLSWDLVDKKSDR